jgi:hypothetical protein
MLFTVLPADTPPEAAKAARAWDLSAIITAAVATFLVVLAALTHTRLLAPPDATLDLFGIAGLLALGFAVPQLGQRAQVTANTAAVLALHKRVDGAGIPPAADGHGDPVPPPL